MVNPLALKAALKAAIDAAAETELREYITAGAGQALIYAENADEAAAYLEAAAPVDEDYPLLLAEIGITGATTAEVANVINASFTTWQTIGAAIEATRLGTKKAIDAATDAEAAIGAASVVNWPS
ncbi:hypothetical protein ELI49_04850 [Rhizobium ruizarguesonis]|nr:hypothetical protein [Rhizobium ruizarguesonis]QIJ39515.1 hypothetical protein G7039_04960 [Rhizobium leguminosarum]NEH32164.1 hypothetical protein [Rhizobium ruizarguesonis]NEJ09408.1 hypothetical protein [Rhizobium ruizarguesonis]NEK12301.1 hypothetical protein [Rhizobium ruizarguesonis]TAU09118.1 hypothetical protein ELI49_04850 [Rhizobium ruizarguesonis]